MVFCHSVNLCELRAMVEKLGLFAGCPFNGRKLDSGFCSRWNFSTTFSDLRFDSSTLTQVQSGQESITGKKVAANSTTQSPVLKHWFMLGVCPQTKPLWFSKRRFHCQKQNPRHFFVKTRKKRQVKTSHDGKYII